jgi:transcriptional regulator NrdR family protein
MVCILCDSKTKTTNSRPSADGHQTWRRHTCKRCSAVFTTRESADMSIDYRFERADGLIEPFSRDTVFLSIVDSMRHRPDHIRESTALTQTVLSKLQSHNRLIIRRRDVTEAVYEALRHYNIGTAQIYRSLHG